MAVTGLGKCSRHSNNREETSGGGMSVSQRLSPVDLVRRPVCVRAATACWLFCDNRRLSVRPTVCPLCRLSSSCGNLLMNVGRQATGAEREAPVDECCVDAFRRSLNFFIRPLRTNGVTAAQHSLDGLYRPPSHSCNYVLSPSRTACGIY